MEQKDLVFICIVAVIAICAIFCIVKISLTPQEYVITERYDLSGQAGDSSTVPTGMATSWVDEGQDTVPAGSGE